MCLHTDQPSADQSEVGDIQEFLRNIIVYLFLSLRMRWISHCSIVLLQEEETTWRCVESLRVIKLTNKQTKTQVYYVACILDASTDQQVVAVEGQKRRREWEVYQRHKKKRGK